MKEGYNDKSQRRGKECKRSERALVKSLDAMS